jgi:hypothetical protein
MRATVFGGKMRDAMRPKSLAAVQRNQSLNLQCVIGVRKRTPHEAAEKYSVRDKAYSRSSVDNAGERRHSSRDDRRSKAYRTGAVEQPVETENIERRSMRNVKLGKVIRPVRLPDEVVGWLEKRATYNGATLSAEIVSAVRERMEREAQAATDRALASAGA